MQNLTDRKTISLIIPCFNEQESINTFLNTIKPIITSIQSVEWEIIFVDDGSRDKTLSMLITQANIDDRLKVIGLSRNFGKEVALTAGIDHAIGDAIIPMDIDLQDPPELLRAMIDRYQEGWAVVQAVRRRRDADSWLKRISAAGFYWFMSKITTITICPNVGDFQLLSREVVEAVKQYPERTRFMKGITASVGFKRIQIPFDRPCRAEGTTKFSFWRLWNFAIDGITAFSTIPLRIWSYIGLIVAGGSFIFAVWLVFRTLYFGVVTPGYASIFTSVLFLGGLQLIGILLIIPICFASINLNPLTKEVVDVNFKVLYGLEPINFLIENDIQGRIMNSTLGEGGYLESIGKKAFIDGRLDLFEDEMTMGYVDAFTGKPGWDVFLTKHDPQILILRNEHQLKQLLLQKENFIMVYEDQFESIFLKNEPVYQKYIQRFAKH